MAFGFSGINAGIVDRLLQIRVKSVAIDLGGYILVRIKEDGIVWARLPSELRR